MTACLDTCVVITGASGFLGKAMVKEALERPGVASVIATHRRATASAPDPDKPRCIWATGIDLSCQEDADRLRSMIEADRSPRKVLVHCAGHFPPYGALHRTKIKMVEATISANVLSYIGAIAAVIPEMRRLRYGRIIAFSSHTRHDAFPYMASFNLAKAALEAAVAATAHENARYGIAANTICVATMQTEAERTLKPSGAYSDWLPPQKLAMFSLDCALTDHVALNANNIHYWNYSESFFGRSVFHRNSIDIRQIDPEVL